MTPRTGIFSSIGGDSTIKQQQEHYWKLAHVRVRTLVSEEVWDVPQNSNSLPNPVHSLVTW